MRLYHLANRVPVPRSYVGKLLVICFLGTHAPLIAFATYAVLALPLDAAVMRLAGLILLATLGGTAVTLALVRGLLSPIVVAERALKAYVTDGVKPALPTCYRDEAGALLAEIQHVVDHLESTHADLARQAMLDPLTNIGNRRWLAQESDKVLAQARRQATSVSVIIFDIDHFKRLNDRFGHNAGDAVLRGVADTVRGQLRPLDLLARTGGEEFCIVCPDTDNAGAATLAERLRESLACASHDGLAPGVVTASFGVACTGGKPATLGSLMSHADARLYAAKHGGRNRVVVWSNDTMAATAA